MRLTTAKTILKISHYQINGYVHHGFTYLLPCVVDIKRTLLGDGYPIFLVIMIQRTTTFSLDSVLSVSDIHETITPAHENRHLSAGVIIGASWSVWSIR